MSEQVPPSAELLRYAETDTQRKYIQAWIDEGSSRKAAAKFGINKSSIIRSAQRAMARAAKAGWMPGQDLTQHVGEGYGVTGQSILLGQDGEVKLRWVKTGKDNQRAEEWYEEFKAGVIKGLEPLLRSTAPEPSGSDQQLLSQLFIGDGHFGMYAWGEETGSEDFDCEIAARDLITAARDLIDKAPRAETIVIANVGDFIHMNSTLNTTLRGTQVDVDTRMARVMRIAGMTLRKIIDMALEKFPRVVMINSRGNHDDNPAIALAIMLQFFYENYDRVIVPEAKGYYHWLEWGKWLWGYTHGDKASHRMLADMMARELPEAWGRTLFRWWITGHYHRDHVITMDNGVKVKVCNPLVPPDGWHASMGYGGEQSMELTTFRKEGGVHSTYVHNIIRPKAVTREVIRI